MIQIASVIDGFKVILGSLPLQLGMLLTILISIRVPELEDGNKDKDALVTYVMLCIVHILLFTQIFFNHYAAQWSPMFFSATNVVCMLVQVITQIFLCVNWVFKANIEQEWLDARTNEDWQKFFIWTKIEVLIFVGYLFSPSVFNLVRSI